MKDIHPALRIFGVPGLVWDSITYSPETWKSVSEAWASKGIVGNDAREEMVKLFKAMIGEWRLYDDHTSISQLRYQDKFLAAVYLRINWAKSLPKNTLCELILHMIAAREQFVIIRQKKPTETRKPDSTLARTVEQFMNLYKIRVDKKPFSYVAGLKPSPCSLDVTTPYKKIFCRSGEVNTVYGDSDEISRRGEEIALAIRQSRLAGNKSEAKRINTTGSMVLPLRPKVVSTNKEKVRGPPVRHERVHGDKKHEARPAGSKRQPPMVGTPFGPFLVPRDRLPGVLAREGERRNDDFLDFERFKRNVRIDSDSDSDSD
ncbi:hypothetical protein F4781DRAFT_435887 [Annulohypoxylon bovei var. microspora]|nr:hypothetical protein F4781DRAFT_435887 [Annulohypoxylon bovei var. microspora]